MGMNPAGCFRALGRAHTYDLGGNGFLRTGILVGLLVSILPLAGTEELPFTLLLVPSLLLGLIFGVMGTILRDRDRLHERDLAALSGLAMTDPLTGLYNRRYVEEALKNLLDRAERGGGPVSVVFFDLDHFKQVNQTQGHRGGDLMLQRVAEALRTVVRKGEILGRYGGDEFLLVVAADLSYAANLVERAVGAVQLRTGLSLSAGVARSGEDGSLPEELIAAADARLEKVQERHHAEQGRFRY